MSTKTRSKNVTHANDLDFDMQVLRAELPVLVELGAAWCGPCRLLEPIVEAIGDENVGRFKVVVVDIDESPEVASRYGVRAAPTVMVFRGGERTATHTGLTTKARLMTMLGG